MKNKLNIFKSAILIGALSLQSCGGDNPDTPTDPNNNKTKAETADSTAHYAFANSVNPPHKDYRGPKFELSHNYPDTLPAGGSEMPWLKVDVDFTDKNPDWSTGKWKDYMQAIIDYAFIGQDPNLVNSSGWKTQVKGSDRWFHVPWMAYNKNAGREFIHGCTSERIAALSDFNGTTKLASGIGRLQHAKGDAKIEHFETWAVGMYNDYAGYSFNQLFPESGVPALDANNLPKGLPFYEGACVIKTLFTTATKEDVPFLVNAPEWKVNRHVLQGDTTYLCERTPQAVHLVQVDVAVVDPRSPTNWVFGTFAYNGTLSGATAKDRLDPVGIQYAMDDQTFPAIDKDTIPAYQSVLNDSIDIYEHFGCHGRLCGPVDNPQASCMSCHGGAYTAPMTTMDTMGVDGNIPPIFGFPGICDTFNIQNQAFFSSRKFPEAYFEGLYSDAIPLDFSLQVQVAFTQYKIYKFLGTPGVCKPNTPK